MISITLITRTPVWCSNKLVSKFICKQANVKYNSVISNLSADDRIWLLVLFHVTESLVGYSTLMTSFWRQK